MSMYIGTNISKDTHLCTKNQIPINLLYQMVCMTKKRTVKIQPGFVVSQNPPNYMISILNALITAKLYPFINFVTNF